MILAKHIVCKYNKLQKNLNDAMLFANDIEKVQPPRATFPCI